MANNGRNLPEDFKEFDASYSLSNNGRFRVSIFKQRGNVGIVMRVIPPEIGSFQDLKLPTVLTEIVKAPNGLVLVTGPTGHGKSTTLASMINYINEKYSFNIITIEDPIEFLFSSRRSCIIQREVGIDTDNFSTALTFSTLHTPNAVTTINRLVGHFPPDAQEIIRQRLADILVATVSLRLVEDKEGENVIPVVEVMRVTTTIQACIRDGNLDEINGHIEKGSAQYQMQSMDQHLIQLCKKDIITMKEAKRVSNSMDLERKLNFT